MTRKPSEPISRRAALATITSGGVALAATAAGCRRRASTKKPKMTSRADEIPKGATKRQPTVFLPHGGGPWPFIDERVFGAPGMWDKLSAYLKRLAMVPPAKPKAVLMISAHWEEAQPTVSSAASPPMLYDYYNFPKEAYEVKWPAPGQPELAQQVRELLEGAGMSTQADAKRGFDHGTFVPLKLTYPAADMPTVQLSLLRGLDPAKHLAIGRAIAPLRNQGVFIIGSGMSYHNLKTMMASIKGAKTSAAEDSKAFDSWLREAMTREASRRETALVEWEKAPKARACHPREEHLLPLMVAAGAALADRAEIAYRDVVMGAHVSAIHFG